MTTSFVPTLSLEGEVPRQDLWFFRNHFQNFVHEILDRTFRQLSDAGLMTQARLAERIHRDAASVCRALNNPRNMTFNTFSDLMVGMGVDPTTLLSDEVAADKASRAEDVVIAGTERPTGAPESAAKALAAAEREIETVLSAFLDPSPASRFVEHPVDLVRMQLDRWFEQSIQPHGTASAPVRRAPSLDQPSKVVRLSDWHPTLKQGAESEVYDLDRAAVNG